MKNKITKGRLKIVFVVVISLLITYSLIYGIDHLENANSIKLNNIKFAEIVNEFNSNSIKAKDKYNNDTFIITGKVTDINNNGNVYLYCKEDKENNIDSYEIKCKFENEKDIYNFNENDDIKIIGKLKKISGFNHLFNLSYNEFYDCKFIKKG